MSTGVTRTFLPTLRRLEGELALPLPQRLSILRELESDLEQLTNDFVAQGHRMEHARAMAIEALVPEGLTLGELSRVHASRYARLTRGVSGSRLRVLERSALGFATLVVLAVEAVALIQIDLLADASPFLWPVSGLALALFMAIAAKTFTLWVKQDHGETTSEVNGILVLSGLILAVGCGGVAVDFYVLAGTLQGAPDQTALLLPWLRRDGALLSVSMLASMAGGLTWFMLTQWVVAMAAARQEALGLGTNEQH